MRHYLFYLLTNIYSKKLIVYRTKKIGNWSLFIWILFEIDQTVSDRLNIAVT